MGICPSCNATLLPDLEDLPPKKLGEMLDNRVEMKPEVCENCDGKQYVTVDSMANGEFSQYESPCPDCNGASDEDKYCDMTGATEGDR